MKPKMLVFAGFLTIIAITWASSIVRSNNSTPEYVAHAQGTYSACDLPVVYLPSVMTIPPLVSAWETEPNSPYYIADGPILPQQEYYGYPDDDRDYWSLYLPTQGTIIIDLLEMSAPGQLQLFYQTATDENRVASDIIPPYQIEYAGTAGLYYVLVGTSSGYNRDFRYILKSQFPSSLHVNGTLAFENDATRQLAEEWVGYNFEVDTEKWGTSEGDFKLAELETSREEVCRGSQSLKLTTELRNDADDLLYLDTEAVGYFNNAVPQGMIEPGPYDLTGKRVSCYVYVPEQLVTDEPTQAYFNIFVKDPLFGNQYSERLYMAEDLANTWQQISLVVGERGNGYMDIDFDPANVSALGVVVGIVEWSPIHFIGSVYIDHCEIEYP